MNTATMTMMRRRYRRVAVLALVLTLLGFVDAALTVTRDSVWMARVAPGTVIWLDGAPMWAMASWALAAGSALAGALGLIARSRWAAPAFALTLPALGAMQVWAIVMPAPGGDGPGAWITTVLVWLAALALLGHAIRGWRQGMLH